ncbi:MAG TPA: hypothetical protein VF278_01230 [Pirellulales bacterium]
MTLNASSELWGQLIGEFASGDAPRQHWNALFTEGVNRVGLVREALGRPGGNHRAAAVALIQQMSGEEQKQLFPELMQLARAAHGPVAAVRKIITDLPREWVLPRIDAEVETILHDQQYDDYWMLLELLDELDHSRAAKLARRAAANADPDIRELGTERLSSIEQE